MAASAFPPPKFKPDGNTSVSWRKFKDELANYFIAADLSAASGERKIAILLYSMGTTYQGIFSTFTFADANAKKNYNTVLSKFDAHFEPKRLTKLYMKKFDACHQDSGESIGEYVARLRQLAQNCEFGDTLNNQLCKQISTGVRSTDLRNKLWSEDLTLDQIINKCHLHEQ